MKIYDSPLRYPGGKGRLADFIKLIFENNSLIGGCYIEPYAGGASIALALLYNSYASRIVINDFDKSIYAFWYSTLNHTEELSRMIKDTKINMTVWRKQKAIQKNKTQVSLLELGFSTFFLNRTNRSGVIRAGVIGGNEQLGNYKIDARFNKEDLIKRIQKVGKYEKQISLYNLDACALIENLQNTLPKNTLLYFDPPYYEKGKELYVNYYKHEDHAMVAQMINKINQHKWIVSYDNVSEIKELYKRYHQYEYSLSYSLINATKGTEVMIYSNNLLLPKVESPIKIAS